MAPGLLTAEKYGDFIIQTLIVEGCIMVPGESQICTYSFPLQFRRPGHN